MKAYLVKEPTRDPYEGAQMLLGRDNFDGDVDDASIVVSLNEGRNEELRAGLRTLDERHIAERRNIPYFEARYQHLVLTYATIQGLKSEAEELKINLTRLYTHLRKDLVEFGQEVYGEDEENLVPSVIRNMLEQLSEPGRRYLGIKVMIQSP